MPRASATRLTRDDLHLHNEGTHHKLHEKLGAHAARLQGVDGTYFAVWASNAEHVSVLGDWNGWSPGGDTLRPRESSGIWEGFVPHVSQGARYNNELTFRAIYAFHENFVLPLSHDEVVHGKGSLIGKMPGDEWQRFANLRLLYAYMWAQPGKKLLFMGGEFGQVSEWNHDASLDWWVTQFPLHSGVRDMIREANRLYRSEPALHRKDCDPAGFEWIAGNDSENSVLSFLRRGDMDDAPVVVICNFTPVVRHAYRVGVDVAGPWLELLNTDASSYAGSGVGNAGEVQAEAVPWHGRQSSLQLTLPPLAALWLKLKP